MIVTADEVIPKDTKDFSGIFTKLKAGSPGEVVAILAGSTPGFFQGYEASGWKCRSPAGSIWWALPLRSRNSFATRADCPASPASRCLHPCWTSLTCRPLSRPYKSRYGLVPTQRSFFVFEATYLEVDAIRRAGSDQPDAIKQALKTTTMPSRLGGSYSPDDHNSRAHGAADFGVEGRQAGRDRDGVAACFTSPACGGGRSRRLRVGGNLSTSTAR